MSSFGWILYVFFTRSLEKHVHFVAKKPEKYMIFRNRPDFQIHIAGHPETVHSLSLFLRSLFSRNFKENFSKENLYLLKFITMYCTQFSAVMFSNLKPVVTFNGTF